MIRTFCLVSCYSFFSPLFSEEEMLKVFYAEIFPYKTIGNWLSYNDGNLFEDIAAFTF